MIPQKALDALAQGVARQVHLDTQLLVGFAARPDDVGQRVIFTFQVGVDRYSHQDISLDDLKRANSWQSLFEQLVRKTLEDTAPWAHARKLAQGAEGQPFEPEIRPVIDQAGRRHFRLKAETGLLLSPFGGSQTRN